MASGIFVSYASPDREAAFEPFAAVLALKPRAYACDYVGQVPSAKGYGAFRMYHLRRGAPR